MDSIKIYAITRLHQNASFLKMRYWKRDPIDSVCWDRSINDVWGSEDACCCCCMYECPVKTELCLKSHLLYWMEILGSHKICIWLYNSFIKIYFNLTGSRGTCLFKNAMFKWMNVRWGGEEIECMTSRPGTNVITGESNPGYLLHLRLSHSMEQVFFSSILRNH